jgi:type VI secretion system protein ImpC
LQEPEDSATVKSPDPETKAVISPAQMAKRKHTADCLRFANNLLLSGKPALSNADAILSLLNKTGPKGDEDRQRFLAPLGFFATDLLAQLDLPAKPARKPMAVTLAIDQRVAEIDKQLSEQLRAIMHAENFQALEATWRGLHYLVARAETGRMLKLHVFNATKAELLHDLDTAVEKDQSRLFKLIYEAAYGTLGGQPYSVLVGGYEVGKTVQDIDFLSKMSEIAASAHAPFITGASPALFGMDDFSGLDRPRDLEQIFESADLVGFQEFRKSEDSRYVTLVLPHMLLRLPYGDKSLPADGLAFEEAVDAKKHNDFLWGNAAYLLAERITNAYSLYGWTAAIRGVEGGGLIEGLPLYTYPIYPANSDAKALFCPTEVSITDRREKELSDLGFITLCHNKGTGTAAFFGGQTTNQPKVYLTDEANSNAKLSALLPYMLSASRFAHYVKVIMRDKIGSFMTRGNVEIYLNTWIAQYVLLDENAHQDAKASYPLSQAKVMVNDVPGSPGTYTAVIFLRPHFQLEELTTSIRLVASLPT